MQRLIEQTKALKGAPSTRFSTSSPATGQPAEQRGLRYGAFNFPHLASNKEMTHARQNGVEEVSLIQTYLSSSLSLSLPSSTLEEGANFQRFSPPPRDVPIYRAFAQRSIFFSDDPYFPEKLEFVFLLNLNLNLSWKKN